MPGPLSITRTQPRGGSSPSQQPVSTVTVLSFSPAYLSAFSKRIPPKLRPGADSRVEIWEAHAAPETLTTQLKAESWLQALKKHKLRPIGYAGGLRRETLQICRWLGIPFLNGGLRGLTPDQATTLCREMGVRFNLENHPEKTAAELLEKIGDGGEGRIGATVDTGWFGTQGYDAAQAGWLDERQAALESLTAIRRAGADLIVSYWTRDLPAWL